MKKIVLLIALIVLGMHCYAQTDDDEFLRCYFTPRFYTAIGQYNGFGIDLDFEEGIAKNLYLKANTGLYFSPSSYNTVGTELALALKYQFNPYLFALFDMQPNMRLQGCGHQVYGDYLTFYIRSGVGVGSNVNFNEYHQVYMQVQVCGDIVLLDEMHSYNGSVYLMVGVGYRYKFF